MANGNPEVDNVTTSYSEIERTVATQGTRIMELLIAKKIPTPVANSMDDIWAFGQEKERTRACSVVHNVMEQILYDLLRGGVIDEITNNHIAK